MSPRTKEQFKKIRETKRFLIRSTALRLFSQKGYHETSISLIAKEANISKGLLYNYYAGKESLLRDIITQGLLELEKSINQNNNGIFESKDIISMLQVQKEMMEKDIDFWTLYFSVITQPSVLDLIKPEIMNLYSLITKLFENFFQKEGYKEPKMEALFLAASLDGIFFNYILNPKSYPIDLVIKKIINLYT